jgi:hypothetical protein
VREAWRAAREKGNDAWNLFSDRGGRGKAPPPTDDSVGMVRGSKTDLFSTDRDVAGILTRESSRERGSAVELAQDDMQGQRADYVEATMLGGAAGLSEGSGPSGAAGFGPYTSRAFFSGRNPAATDRSGSAQSALAGTKAPPANRQKAENQGKMSNPIAAHGLLEPRMAGNHNPARGNMAWRSLAQLGDTRAYAMLAKDPLCTATSGCPPEYASTNTSLTYDGIKPIDHQNIILAGGADSPKIDGISVPNVNVPDDSQLDQYIDETNKIDAEAAACREADQHFAPLECQATNDYLQSRKQACDLGCPTAPSNDAQYFSSQENYWAGQESDLFTQILCCGLQFCGCPMDAYNDAVFRHNFNAQCNAKVTIVEARCDQLDNLRKAHYDACPIMQKDGAFEYRCHKSPDVGGYMIPSCGSPMNLTSCN